MKPSLPDLYYLEELPDIAKENGNPEWFFGGLRHEMRDGIDIYLKYHRQPNRKYRIVLHKREVIEVLEDGSAQS